jgi:hypothetical protein
MKCNPTRRSFITSGGTAYRTHISNIMSIIQRNWYYRRTGTLDKLLPWTEFSPRLISSLQETQPIDLPMLFTFNNFHSCYFQLSYICQPGLSVIQDSNNTCRSTSSYFTQELWHLLCDRNTTINTLLHSLLGRLLIGILLRKCYTTLFGLQESIPTKYSSGIREWHDLMV